jgi:hypothetical protein
VTAWPTALEATITFEPAARSRYGGASGFGAPITDEDELAQRSIRRAVGKVRRYAVHNGLCELMTLTYADVPSLDEVPRQVEHFWRRWRRATGSGIRASILVPEWGETTGRLHLHVAIGWWKELGAVEVCGRCALPALEEKRTIPPAGSLCVGCLWGHGFVGAPDEKVADPHLVARYVSKYLGKDFRGDVFGRQRYRVARGFQPHPVTLTYRTRGEARAGMYGVFGGEMPARIWPSDEVPYVMNGRIVRSSFFCEKFEWDP